MERSTQGNSEQVGVSQGHVGPGARLEQCNMLITVGTNVWTTKRKIQYASRPLRPALPHHACPSCRQTPGSGRGEWQLPRQSPGRPKLMPPATPSAGGSAPRPPGSEPSPQAAASPACGSQYTPPPQPGWNTLPSAYPSHILSPQFPPILQGSTSLSRFVLTNLGMQPLLPLILPAPRFSQLQWNHDLSAMDTALSP